MYASFFRLNQQPFSIAPDPRYLFVSEHHREALAHLLYGLDGGGGFVLLTGEIGAGKTTVCRCFLEQVPGHCNIAYIFNPKLTVTELLKSVCSEFHIPGPPVSLQGHTVKDCLDPLNEFLLRTHSIGQNNVLIIDEAQNLSAEVLEQLRLLTNLETNERKLLQIILIGQPELRTMLARPELEQLAQRVIARFHLQALSATETAQYIRHRLGVAGMNGTLPFDSKVMRHIHQATRGVPRRINLLCDRALLGAYATGSHTVSRRVVDKAAAEVFGSDKAASSANSRIRAAVVAAALVAGAALFGADRWLRDRIGGDTYPRLWSALTADPALKPPAAEKSRLASARTALSASAIPAVDTVTAITATPPAARPGPLPTDWSAAQLQASFNTLDHSEKDAWRALAPAWKLVLDAGDPCQSAQRQQVQCFRATTNLALIRQLDRPGILTLHSTPTTHSTHVMPGYALLTGLTRDRAALQINGLPVSVSLASLSTLWRGDFATFWRMPPGHAGFLVDADRPGPFPDWLAAQLKDLNKVDSFPETSSPGPSLKTRIASFQVSQGLKSDGLAGPTTFMQFNRATGVDEPRLLAVPGPVSVQN